MDGLEYSCTSCCPEGSALLYKNFLVSTKLGLRMDLCFSNLRGSIPKGNSTHERNYVYFVIFILPHSLKPHNMLNWKSSLSRKKGSWDFLLHTDLSWLEMLANHSSNHSRRTFVTKGKHCREQQEKWMHQSNLVAIPTISNHRDGDKRQTTMKMKQYNQNKIWKSEEGKKRNKTPEQNKPKSNKTPELTAGKMAIQESMKKRMSSR